MGYAPLILHILKARRIYLNTEHGNLRYYIYLYMLHVNVLCGPCSRSGTLYTGTISVEIHVCNCTFKLNICICKTLCPQLDIFVCVVVLWPSQPNGVMSSAVSLPNRTFIGQFSNQLTSNVQILSPETDNCPS